MIKSMGNKNPVIQTESIYRPVGEVIGDIRLAKKSFQITLPQDVDRYLRSLPREEKITKARTALTELARAEMKEKGIKYEDL